MDGDNVMKELREPAVVSTVPTSQTPGPTGAAREPEIWRAGLDQPFHQAIARLSGGLSPLALSQASGGTMRPPGCRASPNTTRR
jgi:Poly-beta-hydroxybutyrate polymerase N terminal